MQWQGHTIRGILDNDPFNIPGLKSGAKVEVKEDALFDYLLVKRDGTQEGNETAHLMKRQVR